MTNFSFHELIELLESVLALVFEDISNTESGNLYYCSEFPVERKKCTRIIWGCDIHEFGLRLSQRLETIVLGIPELENFWFVVMGMGQNMDAAYTVENVFNRFDLPYLEELVVHVAVDAHKPGNAIFWKYDKLEPRTPGKLTASYFPLMIRNAGNFYFSMNDAKFGKQSHGHPSIRMKKFYNGGLKYVHKIKNAPFKKSGIGQALWNSMFSDNEFTLAELKKFQDISRLLKVYRNNVAFLVSQTHLRCRAEFIVSTLKPTQDAASNSVEMVQEEYEWRDYNREYGFKILEMEEVAELVRRYLDPALNTIEREVAKCLDIHQRRDAVEIYTMSVEKYHNVVAAEAIASFFTYGTAVSKAGEKCHNNNICRMLGLQQRDFLSESEDGVFNNRIWLDEDGNINLEMPEDCVIDDLCRDQEIASSVRVSQVLKNLVKEWGSPAARIVARMFTERILMELARTRNHREIPVDRLCKETHKFLRPVRILAHSKNLLERLFDAQQFREYRRRNINALNSIIKAKLGPARYGEWQDLVCNQLECIMWRQSQFIVVPLNDESCLICLPMLSLPSYHNTPIALGYPRILFDACKLCFEDVSEALFKKNAAQLVAQMTKWPATKLERVRVPQLFRYLIMTCTLGRNVNAIPVPVTVFRRM